MMKGKGNYNINDNNSKSKSNELIDVKDSPINLM